MSQVYLVGPQPSAERDALRRTVRTYLARHRDGSAWRGLAAELGVTGLALPEQLGGGGGGIADVAVVVEETGRVLAPVPYLSTALVAMVVAEAGADLLADRTVTGICDGSVVGAAVLAGEVTERGGRLDGLARHVVADPRVGLVLVRAADAMYAVSATDVDVEPEAALDETRPLATLRFTRAPAESLPVDPSWAHDVFRVLLAAESVAAAELCLDSTVAYLKTRVAFGRPIGSFQALKHRCADLCVQITAARASAAAAVAAAERSAAELAVLAPFALAYCARAFWQVTAELVQMHGGIAFTWEHDAHRYLKRAKSTQLLNGRTTDVHRLVGERAGLFARTDQHRVDRSGR